MTQDPIETTQSNHKGQLIHWAANYDRLLSVITLGTEGRFRRRIIEAAGLSAGERVLDVGCGTGTLAIEAARRVGPSGHVNGIDPSPEMIARARSKAHSTGQTVEFHEAGIQSLPFPDHSFDSVLSSLMFHHLDGPLQKAGLTEIHRVLSPGGRLTIIDFAGHGPLLHRVVSHFSHDTEDRHAYSGSHFDELALEAGRVGFHNLQAAPFKPRFLTIFTADVGPHD